MYDVELAKRYIVDCIDEGIYDVLTVVAHPSRVEEYASVVRQLKFLGRKYGFMLYDPQIPDYIDISEDTSEVKYSKQKS